MVVQEIHFNWYPATERGETYARYNTFEVGEDNVTEIKEHPAIGEGDKWFYDVIFEDGTIKRIFNPNTVFYKPEDNG